MASSSESLSESYSYRLRSQAAKRQTFVPPVPLGSHFKMAPLTPGQITKRKTSNENPLSEVKMTNEEDLKSTAIKPGTLLTSTENSKIRTAHKTIGETPQTVLSIV